MAVSTKGGGADSWLGALILALIGGLVGTVPLASPASKRPVSATSTNSGAWRSSDGTAPARLWEDPLGAAWNQFQKTGGKEDTSATKPLDYILNGGRAKESTLYPKRPPSSTGDCTVMAVQMNDNLSPDGQESRMSARQAVAGALHRLGLAPEGSRTVRYCANPLNGSIDGLDSIVAYEWWESDPTRHEASTHSRILGDCCLVLYIGERALGDRKDTLRNYSRFLKELLQGARGGKDDAIVPIGHAFLMASGSDQLIHDVKSAKQWPAPEGGWAPSIPVTCINYNSTADLGILFGAEGAAGPRETQGDVLARLVGTSSDAGRPRVSRVLGSDSLLLDLLMEELSLRGIDPSAPENVIAVIHERDTAYGRSLPQSLAEAALRQAKLPKGRDLPANFIPISFLATVDGDALGTSQSAAGRVDTAGSTQGKGAVNAVDAAIASSGQAQLDYIFRALRQANEELAAERAGRLRAVFIGAGDRWDVRPIIQMVRRYFPDVLVMTTDLYGQYSDPTDYNAMRNVVVATHLGLSCNKVLQGDVAPFRTCYDTALFIGVLQAFASVHDNGGSDREVAARFASPDTSSWNAVRVVLDGDMTPKGRVYEVSRDGAVNLDQATAAKDFQDSLFYEDTRVPAPVRFGSGQGGAVPVFFGAFMGLVLVLLSRRIRRNEVGPGPLAGSEAGGAPTLLGRVHRAWGFVVDHKRVVLVYAAAVGTLLVMLGASWWYGAPVETEWYVAALAVLFAACTVFIFIRWNWRHQEGAAMQNQALAAGERALSPWGTFHRQLFLCTGVVWAVASVALSVIARGSGDDGEPFAWCNGISIWSAELIRLVALALGLVFLTYQVVSRWRESRSIEFSPQVEYDKGDIVYDGGLLYRSKIGKNKGHAPAKHESEWTAVDSKPVSLSVINWVPVVRQGPTPEVDAECLEAQLTIKRSLMGALSRIIILALPLALVVWVACRVSSPNLYAVRGALARGVDLWLGLGLAVVVNAVVLVVWDEARVHTRYSRNLATGKSRWGEERTAKAGMESGVDRGLVSSLMDIEDIAERTGRVNKQIYWPVGLILLSALALHPRFDALPMDWATVLSYGLSVLMAIYAGFMLRKAAEDARSTELRRLEAVIDRPDVHLSQERIRNGEQAVSFIEAKPLSGGALTADNYEVRVCVGGMTEAPMDPDVASWFADSLAGSEPAAEFVPPSGAGGPRGGVLLDLNKNLPSQAEILRRYAERHKDTLRHWATSRRDQAKRLIEKVKELSDGAFAPWSADPFFRATILPIAGYLSVQAVNWVNAMMVK
jgi:hypothetical protein